jgi:hypothetical protein
VTTGFEGELNIVEQPDSKAALKPTPKNQACPAERRA